MEYITTKETANRWSITERRVQVLCKQGKIPGGIPSWLGLGYTQRCCQTGGSPKK